MKSNYKLGFKNEYSDHFYNIQFLSSTVEGGYNKINTILN